MLFNSSPFLVFFLFFFLVYWLVFKNLLRLQNLFLLLGSYLFYAWFDWRFLFLLIGSSLLNYFLGIWIAKSEKPRQKKIFLFIGLFLGIGTLLLFKYFNFFISSLQPVFTNLHTLNLILPIGISFYTFRTLSYLLDVDKKKIEPVTDWIVFFNYVSFFPSVISGPIDRATLLVPQLRMKRVFRYPEATDGIRQLLWGLFKKIVIADNCATLVNYVFEDQNSLPASTLLAGAFFYTLQIYADFSGYSDMAIGIARLIGFNITKNFDYPFFAQNIAEFWRKWHISLTSWMTDYVFTPLNIAFRRQETTGLFFSILINFTIIGIWHGANWTFVLFGFLHGCFFIPLIIRGSINKRGTIAKEAVLPTLREFWNMFSTFLLVMLTFILFRSSSLENAFSYYSHLFSSTLLSAPLSGFQRNTVPLIFFSSLMLIIEWFQRDKQHALQLNLQEDDIQITKNIVAKSLRWTFYIFLIFSILCFEGREQDFIYLKF